MYKLLIIDDEILARSTMYKDFFEAYFEIILISNEEETILETLRNDFFDGIVLDSTLLSGAVNTRVKKCIEDFTGPIILMSDKREFESSDRVDSQIFDCISLRPYLNCVEAEKKATDSAEKKLIEEVKRGIVKDIQGRTHAIVKKVAGYSDNVKNKKISICHIADLQFGDPEGNEFGLNMFFKKLATYLSQRNPRPDLIVIAGDIVFSGKKEQYELAKMQLEPFLEALYGKEEYYKHLIIVPGNHDYDYSTALIDTSNSVRIDDNLKVELTPSDFAKFCAPDSASYYFSKFAFEMTKDSDYWRLPYKIQNEVLRTCGHRVIGIANATQFQMLEARTGKKRYILDTCGLKVEHAANKVQPNSIVVGHISPRDLGYRDVCPSTGNHCNKHYENQCQEEQQCRKWATSKLFMDAYNATIYLYGHKHFSSCEISNDKKQLFVAAGTPSGLNSEMTFNIIELEDREEALELSLIVNEVGSDNISFAKCEKYTYKKDDKMWEKETNE